MTCNVHVNTVEHYFGTIYRSTAALKRTFKVVIFFIQFRIVSPGRILGDLILKLWSWDGFMLFLIGNISFFGKFCQLGVNLEVVQKLRTSQIQFFIFRYVECFYPCLFDMIIEIAISLVPIKLLFCTKKQYGQHYMFKSHSSYALLKKCEHLFTIVV